MSDFAAVLDKSWSILYNLYRPHTKEEISMVNCENLFKRIDDMEQEYVNIMEEFCLIESPTDFKEGVDAASNYIIQIAESFGWKVLLQTAAKFRVEQR